MGCGKSGQKMQKERYLMKENIENKIEEPPPKINVEEKKIEQVPLNENKHLQEQGGSLSLENRNSNKASFASNKSKASPEFINTDLSYAFPKKGGTPIAQTTKKYGDPKIVTPTNASGKGKMLAPPKIPVRTVTLPKKAYAKKKTNIKVANAKKVEKPKDDQKKPGMTYGPEMEKVILDSMMSHDMKIGWNDIIGMESVKEKLNETLILPHLRPDLFTDLRSPTRGILLYGPPGNGKTMIAKAVVSQCKDINFFNISAGTITTKWFGESEKLIQALFAIATQKQPSVIFIDEIDSILGKRSGGENDAMRRLKTEFLIQFDGVGSGSSEKVVLIGATNRPFDLDEAVLRRFTCRVYIELPSPPARLVMIKKLVENLANDIKEDEYAILNKKIEGYSGADLAALCKEASMEPLREFTSSQLMSIGKEGIRPIKLQDFLKAIKKVSPSVSPQSLKEYDAWTKQNQQ